MPTTNATNSLKDAIYSGNLVRVQALLEEGVDPNQLAVDGHTFLTLAAQHGYTSIVGSLL